MFAIYLLFLTQPEDGQLGWRNDHFDMRLPPLPHAVNRGRVGTRDLARDFACRTACGIAAAGPAMTCRRAGPSRAGSAFDLAMGGKIP